MKIVIQRVKTASVSIDGVIKEKINQGFLLLVGVEDADSNFDLDYAVRKIAQMRIFSDEADKMNLSVQDIQGEILSISQFTLYAETKKGNRPSFSAAGKPDFAKAMYESAKLRLPFCPNDTRSLPELNGFQFQKFSLVKGHANAPEKKLA